MLGRACKTVAAYLGFETCFESCTDFSDLQGQCFNFGALYPFQVRTNNSRSAC